MRKTMRYAVLAAVIGGLLALPGISAAGAAEEGRRSYTDTIDGARFRVEMPERWNGTLLLYSHGYYPPEFKPSGIRLTNSDEAEGWLLDHGYALAGSEFKDGGVGYQVENGLTDQLALLDWFGTHIGRPQRTISTGQSMGSAIAVLLAERHPSRFDGVLPMCSAYDPQGSFNATLDLTYAIKTLLAPGQDIDLVRPRDPQASARALVLAVQQALLTPQGRARIALTASLNNVTGWYSAHLPQPTDPTERIRHQAQWLQFAYSLGLGPQARPDLERRAGGNPSFNTGIDYRDQFARSSQTALVRQAYAAAGLDLATDLDALNAAPRISADPAAVAYLYRYGVPEGTTPRPVLTLHSVGDGGAVPDQERAYAEQVARRGDPGKLRQLYVHRGMHCSFSAADEVVALRALLGRIDTGRWPATDPAALNAQVSGFAPQYHLVLDLGTFAKAPMPPAYADHTPPSFLRPSR
ncbi:MAG: alpha/beta hydrolase family protein [Micromonosporaceae bacterium]